MKNKQVVKKADKLIQLWNDVEMSQRLLAQLDKSVQEYDIHQQQLKQAIHEASLNKSKSKNLESISSEDLSIKSSSSLNVSSAKCRNTLPVPSWAHQNSRISRPAIHRTMHSLSSVVLDDFNIEKGKEVTDREMPRGKRIRPIVFDPRKELNVDVFVKSK